MSDLFGYEPDAHDPGGKVRLRLGAGVNGDAVISEDGRYRQVMRRWLGEQFPERYILFIGMNPSTADASVDDPTCAREWGFSRREGFEGMVKCNVGDYRATHPKMLLEDGVEAVSPVNLPTILGLATKAGRVVLCHGKLNKALAPAGQQLVSALEAAKVPLYCFGKNGDGSPKHPLYLRGDTQLVRF
ncbi:MULTISPECIES: DUF1643 domain-containing protein [unclassified Devosia]|uniref:DUF1643 domain-containing protein n=1 Tax=unclassified Devosia TaxID=196773 RepID=UPI00145E3061|nr:MULTISPECIES: DUF1643 domain-containing protein [unclassified Devosia]MBJ6986247.1 DUF1643 domain-containing protein [Devosia sp. MC521]MBJ7576359.1 DUF1643 domain-containing protein [Devosia sp. MC532]QMW64269.1 DUF1643 domain-containing protein [Devosia sp. MC521]